MDRIIQDSDAESDFMSPLKPPLEDQSCVSPSTGNSSRSNGELAENVNQQSGFGEEEVSIDGTKSSQSLKRRRSEVASPRSSQHSKSKRYRSGELYGPRREEADSVDFSTLLQPDRNARAWDLTPNTRDDFIRNQPTMFSDVTSTVPNNTMTQRQIEAELGLGVSLDQNTEESHNLFADISSLPYSQVSGPQDESQFSLGRPTQHEVPTEPLYEGAVVFQEYESNFDENRTSQILQHADNDNFLEPSRQTFQTEDQVQSTEIMEQDQKQIEVSGKRKSSKTMRMKKKLSSLIVDSDDEKEIEKHLESPPKIIKKRKVGRPKRIKTSPATFGQTSVELVMTPDALADVKQRFESSSLNFKDMNVVDVTMDPSKAYCQEEKVGQPLLDSHNIEGVDHLSGEVELHQSCQSKQTSAMLESNEMILNVGMEETATREPLQEISANVSISIPHTDVDISDESKVGEQPKTPSLKSIKSNDSTLDANGKTLYRVGLSRRARITPLLKSFRK